jgi:lysylphosphatidylglycerol synthetase-like protein (DUF2156 family)
MRAHKNNNVAECVEQWGNADSIALLDPRFSIFSLPTVDGIIGYRVEAQCAVVFTEPVCPRENSALLSEAFHEYGNNQFKSIIYTMASEPFTTWALDTVCKSAIAIGHEIIIDPRNDIKAGNGSTIRRLRNKYNHASRTGVTIKEYVGNDTVRESYMEQLCSTWLQGRQGVQAYHSGIDLFAHRASKRWFYAEFEGKMIGLIMLNRINAHGGWVLNRLLLLPDMPYGTSELLILSVLDILRTEECSYFSAGTTPSNTIEKIHGLGAFSRLLVPPIFKMVQKFMPLEGRQRYWEKFQPRKTGSFLLFDKPSLGAREIYAIVRAFNMGKNSHKDAQS